MPKKKTPTSEEVAESLEAKKKTQKCRAAYSSEPDGLPHSLLLLVKSWVVAAERDSLPLLSSVCNFDCINLHGLVLD